jgi:hypothetical protein
MTIKPTPVGGLQGFGPKPPPVFPKANLWFDGTGVGWIMGTITPHAVFYGDGGALGFLLTTHPRTSARNLRL